MTSLKRKRGSKDYPIYVNGPKGLKRSRKAITYGRAAGHEGEWKFHDVTTSFSPVASSGTLKNSLNLIAQGITKSTRNGRKCTIKSIWCRFNYQLPEKDAVADPAPSDSLRVILYLDKQANGATAAVTDLLETAAFTSFRNLSNQNRFTFMVDRIFNLNYGTLASDGAGVVSSAREIHSGQFYKKCNIPLEFSDVAGAITEIRSNNFGLLTITESGVMIWVAQWRLRFSDF